MVYWVRTARLVGVGLVAVGVLVGGAGVLLDVTAPACDDALRAPASLAGGCQEPGLTWLFTGAALALVGAFVTVATAYSAWRGRPEPP